MVMLPIAIQRFAPPNTVPLTSTAKSSTTDPPYAQMAKNFQNQGRAISTKGAVAATASTRYITCFLIK